MSVFSLAHSNAQNQQRNDDHFGFNNNGFVNGVTRMSDHVRSLNDYTIELVSSHAKRYSDHYELELQNLPSQSQLELARLYIESIDREIEYACYGEDQTLNSDFLCAMLAMLKDNTPAARAKFAQVTIRNILVSYKSELQELLDTACDELFSNEMNEAGYRADYDYDNGDMIWRG